MKRYRKRPIEVEAIQLNQENTAEILGTLNALGTYVGPSEDGELALTLWVEKSQAFCRVNALDWIIAEADGVGYYPCSAAQFAATYEPVES